jgi:O-antigen/teichoic acid export membrane protein
MPANIAKLNPIIFDGQLNYLWISLLTVLQNRLDWLMVSMYMDNRAIATYSVVNRYFEILLFVIGIGFTTLYPWICRAVAMRDTREDKLLKTLRRLLFIPVPLVVVSAAYAFPFIDSLFWHQQYQDAANANLVLLPCAGLATANMLIYYDLMAHKQERYLIFACLASTSLQALFNLFAIPSLGINGAIAGMWLMNISNLAIFSLIYMTRTQSKSEIGSIILIAALMSLLLLAGMALPLFALMSATVLLTVILGALLWKKRNSLLQQPRTEAV